MKQKKTELFNEIKLLAADFKYFIKEAKQNIREHKRDSDYIGAAAEGIAANAFNVAHQQLTVMIKADASDIELRKQLKELVKLLKTMSKHAYKTSKQHASNYNFIEAAHMDMVSDKMMYVAESIEDSKAMAVACF